MVRLTTILLFALLSATLAASPTAEQLPSREHRIVRNFAQAIGTYYRANGKMPSALEEIKDHADLTLDFDSGGLGSFTERYALLPEPVEVHGHGYAAIVSIVLFKSGDGNTEGRMIGFINGNFGDSSGFFSNTTIDPLLAKAKIQLKPIGGAIPPPSWAKPPSKDPIQTEYGKRVDEAFARGEIPITLRNDKEEWRDQKTPEPKPAEIPATEPTSAPTSPTKQPADQVWWIVGLIILAAGAVFVARKKMPKA